MGAPFHLNPFDAEPVDPVLDLVTYPYDDEIDPIHPMRELRHSPFWAMVCDVARDSRERIEVACLGFALLAFVLVAGRIGIGWLLGHQA
jgi:hypothetical protein